MLCLFGDLTDTFGVVSFVCWPGTGTLAALFPALDVSGRSSSEDGSRLCPVAFEMGLDSLVTNQIWCFAGAPCLSLT